MAGKPRKIVMAADDNKKFSQPGAIEVLRAISEKQEWSLGFVVWAASEVIKPKAPADVAVAEIEAATAEIVSRGKREKGEDGDAKKASGRLPLNDESQKKWDSGEWRDKLTVHGLRQRFSTEIKDNVDLTMSMINAYAAELATEKARIVELLDEQPDPESKLVACGSPVHRGDSAMFQPTVRYRLTRNDAGELVRMKHPKGEDFIQTGNFLVVPAGDEEKSVDRVVPYCPDCREAAWQFGRANETKVTFYTFAGAKRKLDAMKKSVEVNEALASQLKSAGARTFGNRGQGKTWKTDRNWRPKVGAKR